MPINFERDTSMKKISLLFGGLLALVGCTQTTTPAHTTTTEKTTQTTTTTTQTTLKKESTESTTVNENLESFKFDDNSFEIRASRRWLKQESTDGATLSLVGYRSRANVFFHVAKTTETALENVAANSFKTYATQYGITTTLPQIPLKSAVHPTVKTIYDIKKNDEKHVLVLYTVNINGTFVNVVCDITPDIFEDIRAELDSMVNSLLVIK